MKLLLIMAIALIGVASAQNYFQLQQQQQRNQNAYNRPTGLKVQKPVNSQYSGAYSGAYSGQRDNSGRYNDNSGKYNPDKYSGKYIPDDAGKYIHDGRDYDGGFGNYNGTYDPYKHDPSRQGPGDKYKGSTGPSGGSGGSGGANNNQGATKPAPTTPRPTAPTTPRTTQRTTALPSLFDGKNIKPFVAPTLPPSDYKPINTYHKEDGWEIIRNVKQDESDKYYYLYETENKILAEEKGRIEKGTGVDGFYEYVGDDGKLYHVDYASDANGFIPKAAFIPTPPPIPADIQRALDYVARVNQNKKL